MTEAGRRLLEHARGILHQVQNAETDLASLRGRLAGRVAVALGPSLGRHVSADLVIQCRQRFPEATIALHEGQSVNIIEWLASGRVDMGLVYAPPRSPTYQLTQIADIPLTLISPPSVADQEDAFQPIRLKSISTLPLIMLSHPHSIRRIVEDLMKQRRWPLNIVYQIEEVSGIAAILDLVERGEGHTILPAHAVRPQSISSQSILVQREIIAPRLSIPLALALPNNRPMTPLTRRISELLIELVPRQLGL